MLLPLLCGVALAGTSPSLKDQIVTAAGADHMDEVQQIRFRFRVQLDGQVKADREWAWSPVTGKVTRTLDGKTLSFTFGQPKNDAERKADAQFVNDSFWFSPPMHMSWAGADLTVTDDGTVPLPIGQGTAHEVTIHYAKTGGGYTPGDAYDLFLDKDDRIVAWNYRPGDQKAPANTTTFQDYVQAGPLHVATEHRSKDGRFVLATDHVVVTLRGK